MKRVPIRMNLRVFRLLIPWDSTAWKCQKSRGALPRVEVLQRGLSSLCYPPLSYLLASELQECQMSTSIKVKGRIKSVCRETLYAKGQCMSRALVKCHTNASCSIQSFYSREGVQHAWVYRQILSALSALSFRAMAGRWQRTRFILQRGPDLGICSQVQ